MKIPRILIPALLLVLLLSGCWAEEPMEEEDLPIPIPEEEVAPAQEQVLPQAFTLPYLPEQTLDPISCADGIQQTVGALLYEGLFQLDKNFGAQPSLCASSSYDAQTLVWTFSLRSDVLFSDGTPLTASHVLASYNRAKDSPRYAARFSTILAMKGEGSTLTITLNRSNALLPALLDIPIVKAGTESDLVPLGTGAYRWDSTGPALVPHEGWWGGGSRPVARVSLLETKDEDALLYRFSSHDVQLLTADLTGISPIRATSNIDFVDYDSTVFQYVGINATHTLLSDPALRRALQLGFNRSQAVSSLLSGHARATQLPLSPASDLYASNLEETYSHETYVQALAATGLTGKHTLTLLVNSENSFKLSMAKFIAAALTTESLTIQVNALPWEDFQAALTAGNFDLYYGETRLTADWDLRRLLSAGGSLNYGGYAAPEMDSRLAAFATSGLAVDAAALLSYFKSQAPLLPICFKTNSVLVQEGVTEGLTPTAANPFYNLGDVTIHLAD